MNNLILYGSLGVALAAQSANSQFVLQPVAGLPNVASGSVAWADYDNDGRLDFFLSGSLASSLWRNTGSGFSNVTASVAPGLPGLFDAAVDWGDFDDDGRLDLLITGLPDFSGGAVAQVWRNTGGIFTNVPIPGLTGVGQSSALWRDFDEDGQLDFMITGTTNGNSSGAISQLWRNTGSGFVYLPIFGLAGVYFGSLAAGDFDKDGRPDFLITGITNGSNTSISQLWRNTGSGFTNAAIPGLRGVFVSSVAVGDYDNDGFLDFLLQGLSANGFICELWRNTGTGFVNVPVPGLPGIGDGSLAWADYDNDGKLDFLITGLSNGVTHASQLWRNTGSGFTNVPIPGLAGNFDNSLAWGDFDNDNRLDFLIAGTTSTGNVSQIWRNTGQTSNSPAAAPGGLMATVEGATVVLEWTLPVDDHTPSAGLTYDLRLGTTPGGVDILSPEADPATGWRRVATLGNLGENLSATFQLPPGNYYWSVQAVDSAFVGSPFAAEQQFSVIPLLIGEVRHTNGVFQFEFTATPEATFTVVATTDISVPVSNWSIAGVATEVSPGFYQFSDGQVTNHPQRYYRLRSP